MEGTTEKIISAAGIGQRFGSTVVLEDISFEVAPGEVIAILGPNGAGKTTLIDILLGLTHPASGEISVCGLTPRQAVRAAKVGAIVQTGGLLPDITVTETLRMVAATHARPRPLPEVLEDANLTAIAGRRISKLSGGEKQRVKFALALLSDPQLIILDEPTTGMDPQARAAFWEGIYARAAQGNTIIFTTHYLEEAERFAQRIIFLHQGHLLADAPASELIQLGGSAVVEFELSDPAQLAGLELPAHHVLGSSYRVAAADPDTLARELLTQTSARNLRIRAPHLDDVFHTLSTRSQRGTTA